VETRFYRDYHGAGAGTGAAGAMASAVRVGRTSLVLKHLVLRQPELYNERDEQNMCPTSSITEVIHEDRRDDRRYPIEMEVRYEVVARKRTGLPGVGQTINMSSGGVLFSGDQTLPDGAYVELFISWPVLLHDVTPLTLLIVGRVVRCEGNQIAVKTTRYEFLTRGARKVQEIPSRGHIYVS
jgi:hypothetical protein